MTLLHLSDPHFGRHVDSMVAAFVERAEALRPDLTVCTGDFTMRAERRELALAAAFVRLLPQPNVVIPGNHDIPEDNQPLLRLFAPFRRYRQAISPDLEPGFRNAFVQLVSLNTNRAFNRSLDWSTGETSREQRDGLAHRFEPDPPGAKRWRILAMHHPLHAPEPSRRMMVQPLEATRRAVGEAGVDLVLGGHFHVSHLAMAEFVPGKRTLVSLASTLCSTRMQGEPQGFHVLRLEDSAISVEQFAWLGAGFERCRLSRFEGLR